MKRDPKVAVYLCVLDWEAICHCISTHIDRGTVDGKTLWHIGAKRAAYIRSVIQDRLALIPPESVP